MANSDDKTLEDGAGDISGSEPDLESDDDVSDAAKKAGLYEDSDEEHPKEVGIAQEVEKDEKLHQEGD